jgi:hypothetical protein
LYGGDSSSAWHLFGQKKPELLQARVESTMEAVEETNGARARCLNLLRARALTPGGCAQEDRLARILAAAIAAVQYF